MNLRNPLVGISVLVLLTSGASAQDVTLKDQKDKVSYSIGVNMGHSLKQQTESEALQMNPQAVAAGVRDALTGGKMLLTDAEIQEVLRGLQKDFMEKQAQLGEKQKKDGEAFLAANKLKAGVKTLPDGLQYQVLTEGKGAKPKATDTVKVSYKGTFIDGTEFDGSAKRGGPITFPLNKVIKGWTEAIQLMPTGSKWKLFVPSELAYGPQGADTLIPPNATLIFEVELVGIEPPSAAH